MRCAKSVAVLVDGGFVTKILRRQLGHFPDADEVESEIAQRILRNPALADRTLYRVFFYDADPWAQPATNPITRTTVDYAATDVAIR